MSRASVNTVCIVFDDVVNCLGGSRDNKRCVYFNAKQTTLECLYCVNVNGYILCGIVWFMWVFVLFSIVTSLLWCLCFSRTLGIYRHFWSCFSSFFVCVRKFLRGSFPQLLRFYCVSLRYLLCLCAFFVLILFVVLVRNCV